MSLLEQGGVFQAGKNPTLKIRTGIKAAMVAGTEPQLQRKIVSGNNANHGFHVWAFIQRKGSIGKGVRPFTARSQSASKDSR